MYPGRGSLGLLTFLAFIGVLLSFVLALDSVNSGCNINDWKNSPGICIPLRECKAALSNLRAGVMPNRCDVTGRRDVICCPTGQRISEKMCQKYKEVHRVHVNKPLSFVHYDYDSDDDAGEGEFRCAASNPLVFGGRDADTDEYPHMAGLGWGTDPKDLDFICGGTLISDEYVLTAAHCIDHPGTPRPSYVLLGDNHKHLPNDKISKSLNRVLVKIKDYFVHFGYKRPAIYNDIALLQLEHKVNFSTSIVPACLPHPHLRHESQKEVNATGWGQLGAGERTAEHLQAVSLERYPQKECSEMYDEALARRIKYPSGIARYQFCAGDRRQEKDTCAGDSGGPAVVMNETVPCIYHVVGITSLGAIFCGTHPGIYTNVQSYLDWIEQIVWPNVS